jgi:aspartate kinase
MSKGGDGRVRVIVQKFGGTSLSTAANRERAVEWVLSARADGYQPVVVVSAMGREGDPYATDTLLGLVRGEAVDPRERDLLMSCGEIISAVIFSARLKAHGVPALALTGGQAGIFTDDCYGEARIQSLDPEPLQRLLADGQVPVVAGFQGRGPHDEVTTLGRGGSDTTAVAVGAALEAEVVDIFTDVDGIKTADPAIVPQARTLAAMDYDEVFQMANTGARVIHPRAVEIARQFAVPLRIRSTFANSQGTLVAMGSRGLDGWAHRDPDRAVTGITALPAVLQVHLAPPPGSEPGWMYRVFQALGQRQVSVDLINIFPDRAYFCVAPDLRSRVEAVLEDLGMDFECFDNRAKVSCVGTAIHGLPGVMAQVMGALTGAGVEVLQTADSHSTISCLVRREDMERAVRALHRQFHLEGDEHP